MNDREIIKLLEILIGTTEKTESREWRVCNVR